MLTILVNRKDITLTETTGFTAQVRNAIVKEGDKYVSLQDLEPFQEYKDIEIIVMKKFFCRKLRLTEELKQSILLFMKEFHAQQNINIDCYAFALMVKGVKEHKGPIVNHWHIQKLWRRPAVGSVIFLVKENRHFRHAAIYIGDGLYISVWGAGGDLEITTLRAMKRDFEADTVRLAIPL